MLWNTILAKINKHTAVKPWDEGSQDILRMARASGKGVLGYLEDIDVRNAQKLRDIIPDPWPRELQKGDLVVSQNIHGAWRVDPKE